MQSTSVGRGQSGVLADHPSLEPGQVQNRSHEHADFQQALPQISMHMRPSPPLLLSECWAQNIG